MVVTDAELRASRLVSARVGVRTASTRNVGGGFGRMGEMEGGNMIGRSRKVVEGFPTRVFASTLVSEPFY